MVCELPLSIKTDKIKIEIKLPLYSMILKLTLFGYLFTWKKDWKNITCCCNLFSKTHETDGDHFIFITN